MAAELFSVQCTTCRAMLKVRHASAIGQILGCPKCGSMVQVEPPPGWIPAAAPPSPDAVAAPTATASSKQTVAPPVAAAAHAAEIGLDLGQVTPPPGAGEATASDRWWTRPQVVALAGSAVLLLGAIVYLSVPSSGASDPDQPAEQVAITEPTAVETPAPEPSDATVPAEPDSAPEAQAPPNPEPVPAQDAPDPDALAAAVATEPSEEIPTEASSGEPRPATGSAARLRAQTNPAQELGQDFDLDIPAELPPEEAEASEPMEPTTVVRPPAEPPQPAIDVAARMQDRLVGLELADAKLSDAVRILSDFSTIPITFDAAAVAAGDLDPATTVTLRTADSTVEKVLEQLLASKGLTYRVEAGQIVIGPR